MWECKNPRCKRVSKGFPNGKTLCGVCRAIETRKKVKINE